jgi:phospholipase C
MTLVCFKASKGMQKMPTSHSNTVTINDPSNSIANMTYVQNSFQITSGQPSTLPPTFTHANNVFTVTVQAGRSKSTPIASSFNAASGGAGHEYADGGGSTPGQLNFWYSLVFQMQSNNGQTVNDIVINVGQGSYGTTNNWWIGSTDHIIIKNGTPYLVYSNGTNIYSFKLSVGTSSITLNAPTTYPDSPIKNVFVLMLENHSFDNMLAFSGISGITAATSKNCNSYGGHSYCVSSPAPSQMPTDPGHEFTDVVTQLCGQGVVYKAGTVYPHVNNSGFAANYATTTTEGPAPPAADIGEIMECFNTQSQMPNLYALAANFVLCDHWFSSLPGPTWPNRFFLHGASSDGLDHSPTTAQMLQWETVSGFTYPNGSIFDLMTAHGVTWKLYNDRTGPLSGQIPQVSSLKNIQMWNVSNLSSFASDLQGSYPYQYTFIEPSYGDTSGGTYEGGTSQHPMDGVEGGETIIANVYNAIRNSPLWNQSLLIITYDEHGGFYDSVAPGTVLGPNDGSNSSSLNEYGFTFQQYGVRVPAVAVSPLLAAGVDHTVYDHSSALATMEWLFGLPPLTLRDSSAKMITSVATASMTNFRSNTPVNLAVPTPKPKAAALSPEEQAAREAEVVPDRTSEAAFLGVLLKADSELAETPQEKAAARARFQRVITRGHAEAYVEEVMAKVRAKEASLKK